MPSTRVRVGPCRSLVARSWNCARTFESAGSFVMWRSKATATSVAGTVPTFDDLTRPSRSETSPRIASSSRMRRSCGVAIANQPSSRRLLTYRVAVTNPTARRRHLVGRHVHEAVRRKRVAGVAGLLAVLGPGVLAGLSDDDPPGITTYSVLGADHGYTLLWALLASTVLLIMFHELAARMGVMTQRGLLALVREHRGARAAAALLVPLVIANVGTVCAEFAGIAAAAELAGIGRAVAVPLAALGVGTLVVASGFHRVEHVLLAL